MNATSPTHVTGRRFRFRLRTLLVALTAACFAFAWVYRAREQHTAVTALRQANPGVTLRYDDDDEEQRGAFARWTTRWLGVDYVATIEKIELFYATDADLACVARLRQVEWLSLLRSIDLTDTGLALLTPLTKLHTLQISEAEQLTDAGIAHLEKLTSLRILRLDLSRAAVTPQAIERLRRALPNCRIELGPGETFATRNEMKSSEILTRSASEATLLVDRPSRDSLARASG